MHNHGLGSWMTTRRQKTPDKTALIFDGRSTTYRALADDTDRISAVLGRRGIGIGDAVAFLGENSPEFLSVMFACA
jgi:fatty-acyl-CoA synthase